MSEDKGDWLIDAKPLYKLCADLDLDQKDMNRAFKSALSQSGNLIRREALQQLYKVAYKNGPMKNTQFLGAGIIVKVWRSGMGAKVGLFGRENIRYHKNVMKNPSYILRWVEMGTKQRKTAGNSKYYKVAANRGNMEARPFFRQAVEAKQREAEDILEKNIEKVLYRRASKK
jgi:hypothetical protein